MIGLNDALYYSLLQISCLSKFALTSVTNCDNIKQQIKYCLNFALNESMMLTDYDRVDIGWFSARNITMTQ